MNWNPFRRRRKTTIEDVAKTQDRLGVQIKCLRKELTMEEEVYSKDSKTKEIFENSLFNRIPH